MKYIIDILCYIVAIINLGTKSKEPTLFQMGDEFVIQKVSPSL